MATTDRPAHLRWRSIGLVAAGGAAGAACREALSIVIPNVSGVPLPIAIINIVGAFLLGYLYEALTRRPAGDSSVTTLKLLIGTGFCGGFTTYSSLATDTSVLGAHGRVDLAIIYALATVILGALATWAGIAAGAQRKNRQPAQTESAEK